jgi:hypothetical protein
MIIFDENTAPGRGGRGQMDGRFREHAAGRQRKTNAPDRAANDQRSFVPFFTKKDAAKNATIRMA